MNVRSAYARIFPVMTDDLLWRNVSKVLLRKKAFQVLKILTKEQVSASASPFFHPDLDAVASSVGISRRHLLRLINFLEKDGWVFTKKERRRPLLLSANFIKLWQYVSKKLLQDDATMKLLGTTIKFLDQKRRVLMRWYNDYESFREANIKEGIPQDSQKTTPKKRKFTKNNKCTIQDVVSSVKEKYAVVKELEKKIKDEKKREYRDNPDKVTAPEAWRELYLAAQEEYDHPGLSRKLPNGKVGKLLTKFTDECLDRGYSYNETKQLLRDIVKYWHRVVGGKEFTCLLVNKQGKEYPYKMKLPYRFSFDHFYLVRWKVVDEILAYVEREKRKEKEKKAQKSKEKIPLMERLKFNNSWRARVEMNRRCAGFDLDF